MMRSESTARVLLVRHGQSTWNAEGRWQGHADPPLSEFGEQQAVDAAARVGQVDAIYSSDLQRAHRTAELIAAQLGIEPVLVEARLRERDVGEWTGLTRAGIDERWPGWIDDYKSPPGFEDDTSVFARVSAALLELGARHPGGDVLAVAHGGVIRTVERTVGSASGGVPNLGGLVVMVDGDTLALGDRIVLLDADETTVPRSL